jgi:hypothetical protein
MEQLMSLVGKSSVNDRVDQGMSIENSELLREIYHLWFINKDFFK